ncbi:MAG: hypothetical protein NT003_04225 [Candidatus Magasanikbacteria bacterium]|nr:hypothetical protein [Candidatus Magasanikbacteria bacterium]
MGGLFFGVVAVGFIVALPFPYSEFPLIPIMIACALIFRMRPSMFWFLITLIGVTDLYRSSGFGVGIVSFVFLIIFATQISNEIITHRSLVGCTVISLFIGACWVTSMGIVSFIYNWFTNQPIIISVSSVALSALIQSIATAVVCGIIYTLVPRWWHNRSPITVMGSRGL